MLKNANNLILELGSYAFMSFLDDYSSMLDQMSEKSSKRKEAKEILKGFSLYKAGDSEIE